MAITVPVYNLGQVFTLRDKIADNMIAHIGTTPEGPEYERFVDDLYRLLPDGIEYITVYESASYLMSQEIRQATITELGWRLAGNLDTLRAGRPVRPWAAQGKNEWVPVQVLLADRTKTPKGDLAYMYRMRVLAGSPAPMVINKTWPLKVCSYIASKIGFSKPWKDAPYRDGHELVSMRFYVEIDPKLCRGEPGFEHIHCTGSMERWNKDILKARTHVDPPCPYGFTHLCYQCPVGYDQCKAGVHPRTYIAKHCNVCNADTWHDPGLTTDLCMACRDAARQERT